MTIDYLKIMDLARTGQWDDAHRRVQSHSDTLSCLIHGYLHRLEGDLGNAGYWYDRAATIMPENSLDDEFERLYELARDARKR
jgi:hypothetical protein